MRIRSLLPSLLVSVSLPVLASAAALSMNDWHVAPMMASNATDPSYCAMATHYTDGPLVTFTRNASDKGSIAIDFPSAEMDKGQEYAVTLKTDSFKKTYPGRAISATQLVLQTGTNKALDDTMASGTPITVSLDGTPGIYTLQGNVQAFFEFDHCIKGLTPPKAATQMASVMTPPVTTTALAAPLAVAPAPIATPVAKPAPAPAALFDTTKPAAMIASNPAPVVTAPAVVPAPVNKPAIIAAAPAPIAKPAGLFDTTKPAPVMASNPAPILTAPSVVSAPVSKPVIIAAAPVIAPAVTPAPIIAVTPPVTKPAQTVALFDSYKTPAPAAVQPTPQHVAPVPPIPGKPLDLTKPVAPKAPTPPAPQQAAIQWDKTPPAPVSAPVTKAPPIDNYSEITPLEKPSATIPIKNKIVTPEKLAATTPVAGSENSDTSRLKSSLAQARAEAENIQQTDIAPPQPAKIITPPPAPVSKPVTQATPQAAPAIREPLAHASNNNGIQDLLYDDKGVPKKTAAAIAPAPAPVMVKEEKSVPPVQTFDKPIEQKPIIAPPIQKAPTPPPSAPPIVKDEIQTLPPAIPPVVKPTLAVSAEPEIKRAPVATQLNTVTPSVGHPPQGKLLAPIVPVQPLSSVAAPQIKASSSVDFHPPPATANSSWTTRTMDNQSDKINNFCLMENQFSNDTMLMLGQRADGSSTLGINYGVEMLEQNKNYDVTVQIDNNYEQKFSGYAESPKTLVVQIGKQPGFFSTLASSEAARVAIPGAASSYALQGIPEGLSAFSTCLSKIGGMPIAAAAPMLMPISRSDATMVQTEKVITNPLNNPRFATPIQPPKKVAEIKAPPAMPAPIALPPAASVVAPAPAKDALIWDEAKAAPLVTTSITPEPAAKPKPVAPPVAPPVVAMAAPVLPVPVKAPANKWTGDVRNVLNQLDANPNFTGDNAASWSQPGLKGKAVASSQKDILDAASDAMDQAEKSCKGIFSSQMGVPDGATLPMESKCIGTNGVTTISTWVAQQNGNQTTIWSMEAPRDQRDQAFKARDKLLNLLQNISSSGKQS